MPGELPQFYMFPCSHGNISFLRNQKEARKLKESCSHKGRFQYLCIHLRFGNTLGLRALGAASLGDHTHTGTSLTTSSIMFKGMKAGC